MFYIDYNSYRAVKEFDHRQRFLVMHYTAVDFATSVDLLTQSGKVSAHYLVPDPTDPSYTSAGFNELKIFNLVDEQERAWHAGASSWASRTNLNDTSIGIEIVNQATGTVFPPFNPLQIEAVKQLALNIIQRYPEITPTRVVGHSDIAVGRKNDPGVAFPWEALYEAGVGAWYDHDTKEKYIKCFTDQGIPSALEINKKLERYGYDISGANSSEGYQQLIQAFQRHFRASNDDGVLDLETAAIIYALVEKYFSG